MEEQSIGQVSDTKSVTSYHPEFITIVKVIDCDISMLYVLDLTAHIDRNIFEIKRVFHYITCYNSLLFVTKIYYTTYNNQIKQNESKVETNL